MRDQQAISGAYLWHIELAQGSHKVLDNDVKVMLIQPFLSDEPLMRPPHVLAMILFWAAKCICHELYLH